MHDVPYVKQKDLSPEIVSMMTRICTEIRKVTPQNVACGIQVQKRERERDVKKKVNIAFLFNLHSLNYISKFVSTD